MLCFPEYAELMKMGFCRLDQWQRKEMSCKTVFWLPYVKFSGDVRSIPLEMQTATSHECDHFIPRTHPIKCVAMTRLKPGVNVKYLLQLWGEEGQRSHGRTVGRVTSTYKPQCLITAADLVISDRKQGKHSFILGFFLLRLPKVT